MTLRPLNEALQKKAKEELNEVPERIQSDVDTIKEWITKQPHLKSRMDDQWILSFLRGCKFSLQRTKEKIDYYYTIRTLVPEFFKNRDPLQKDLQDVLQQGLILPLPKTKGDADPRMVLFRYGKTTDPYITPLVSLIKLLFMILDILIDEDDNSAIAGQYLLVDYLNLKAGYVVQYTPSLLKKIVLCLQCNPGRLKNICSFNSPSIFETVFNLAKSFMPEKLKSRMVLYSEKNLQNLYEHVPKSFLPKDYGGDSSSIEDLTAEWKSRVESYREWFQEDEKFGTNEDLRSGTPCTSANTFGVEGSFRKLNID